jgi:hypothetical protein
MAQPNDDTPVTHRELREALNEMRWCYNKQSSDSYASTTSREFKIVNEINKLRREFIAERRNQGSGFITVQEFDELRQEVRELQAGHMHEVLKGAVIDHVMTDAKRMGIAINPNVCYECNDVHGYVDKNHTEEHKLKRVASWLAIHQQAEQMEEASNAHQTTGNSLIDYQEAEREGSGNEPEGDDNEPAALTPNAHETVAARMLVLREAKAAARKKFRNELLNMHY